MSMLTSHGLAADTEPWELRVCADPAALPFSNASEEGFENRIASLLADELGAKLSYDWSVFTEDLVNLHFAEGECDVLMGVPDGFERATTTIAYYQSPYVMVYREASDLAPRSLDDPVLAEATIGVQGTGTPPHQALMQRGLLDRVKKLYGGEVGEQHLRVMIDDLEQGVIDVGFGWGPTVGYFAAESDERLTILAVEPEFELPGIFQTVPMTIAVRRNDLALRDLLNQAIAARWDDIQSILAEYHVVTVPAPAPVLGSREPMTDTDVLHIGVVMPMPTGGRTVVAALYDIVGEAGRMGAIQAEGAINAIADETGVDVYLHLASAPSATAARRAAQRLLSQNGVDALVGGIGAGQAGVLADIATRAMVPFLNVGDPSLTLRAECNPMTFHIEPSAGTYIDAMIGWYREAPLGARNASQRWFVIAEESTEHVLRLERAVAGIEVAGDTLAGYALVPSERPTYYDLLNEIAAVQADAVMVLLEPADQLAFMGQAQDLHLAVRLAPFPDPVTQTRDFLAASVRYGVASDVTRIVAWETTLTGGAADDLVARFTSRWGQPMDPTAWNSYQAVRALHDAAVRTGSLTPVVLSAYLASPGAYFKAAKGPGVSFRSADRELRQPLYVVEPDPAADWGVLLSQRIGVARLVGQIPDVARAASDDVAAADVLDDILLVDGWQNCTSE